MKVLIALVIATLIAISNTLPDARYSLRSPANDNGINGYIHIPLAFRQKNWTDRGGNGSCVNASMVMLLRWQRMPELADWWRKTYAGGETWNGFTPKCNAAGLKWAGTVGANDVSFLEWAIDTRRGCMVTTNEGRHMILLVGLDQQTAYLLDNNDPDNIIRKSRDQFLQEWYESNSWALTLCYNPPPPVLRGLK